MKKTEQCFQCGDKGEDLFGYPVCESCKSKLGLLTDSTIQKHLSMYEKQGKRKDYQEEINRRLIDLEDDYKKKRIKLLHVLERLEHLE